MDYSFLGYKLCSCCFNLSFISGYFCRFLCTLTFTDRSMTRGRCNNLQIDYSLNGNFYHTPCHVTSSQHHVTSPYHHDTSPCSNVASPVYQEIPSPLYLQIPSPDLGEVSPLGVKLRSEVPKYFTFLSAQVSDFEPSYYSSYVGTCFRFLDLGRVYRLYL